MNFVWLEDFLVLAASGNFSRAAEERHVTQPAFSRRIRALEVWLGVDLFDRSTHPAQLTEAGLWLQGVASEISDRVERLPGEARRVAESNAATLRIAATHALSLTFLPRWLRALETKTPLGPVQLVSDVLQGCEALMHQRKVQFVLSHAHPRAKSTLESDDFLSVLVGKDVLMPTSAGAHGSPLYSLDAKSDSPAPILIYSSDSGLGRITRAVVGRRLSAIATTTVFTAHLASLLRTMVLEGRGIAWLPRTLIEEDLANQRLVQASIEPSWNIPAEIRLFRSTEPAGRAAESFWAAVREDVALQRCPGGLGGEVI